MAWRDGVSRRLLQVAAALGRIGVGWSGHDRGGLVVREFRRLGGAWLKIGQRASFRRDYLPRDVCDALAVFQGDGGRASIAVVRREGDRAIKEIALDHVRRIDADLACLRGIARAVGWLPIIRRANLIDMVDGITELFRRELDLRIEAASQRAFRRRLHGRPGLYVPRVYAATRYRLEMEYVDGVDLADVITRGDGPRFWRQARRLMLALMRMILEDNHYHADLHRRNVRLMPDGRLALLDFGGVGVTDAGFLRRFRRFIVAIDDRDFRKAADEFMALQVGLVPRTSVGRFFRARRMERVERGLIKVIERWAARCGVPDLPFRERSLHTLVVDLVAVTVAAGASLNPDWLGIQGALQAVESINEGCWSQADYLVTARQYVRAAKRRNPCWWWTWSEDTAEMLSDLLDRVTDERVLIR